MASHFRGGRSVRGWFGFYAGLQQQEVSRRASCFLRSVLIKHSGDNRTKDRSRAVLAVKEIHIYGPLDGATPSLWFRGICQHIKIIDVYKSNERGWKIAPIKANGTTGLSECAVLQRLPKPRNAARNIYNCTLEFTARPNRLTGPQIPVSS